MVGGSMAGRAPAAPAKSTCGPRRPSAWALSAMKILRTPCGLAAEDGRPHRETRCRATDVWGREAAWEAAEGTAAKRPLKSGERLAEGGSRRRAARRTTSGPRRENKTWCEEGIPAPR